MKQDIYFHIGLPRTATTWLQQEFFPKLDLKLVLLHKGKPRIPTSGKVLVSYEGLCGDFRYPVQLRYFMLHGIKKLYPNAKIIICIRNKKSFIDSLYHQGVKSGIVWERKKDWLKIRDNRMFNFNKYTADILTLFGVKRCYIYKYNTFKKDKQKVLTDMCKFLNVKMPMNIKDISINKGYYNWKHKFLLGYNFIWDSIKEYIIKRFVIRL